MACYRVELTDRALAHFRGHIGYIANDLCNPDAALRLWEALGRAIDVLANHPETAPLCVDRALRGFGYRKKRIDGTRYLCLCRVEGDTVWIDGIYHELQDYENLFATGE